MNEVCIDDSLMLGDNEEDYIENVQTTYEWIKWLDFVIPERKYVIKPVKQFVCSLNIIGSVYMPVVLTK